MKNLTYLVMALILMSCSQDDLGKSEGSFLQADIKTTGKPTYITLEEAQILIDESVKAALSADPLVIDANVNFTKGIISDFGIDLGNMEFRNIYYSRMETAPDDFLGIKYLEEINSRDWAVSIFGAGGSSGIWMDGNGGSSNNNITLSTNGGGSYSKYWQTQNWLMINQSNGIYNFPDIKTFDTNEDAKVYFSSVGWNRRGTIYRTSDGTVKATY